MLFGFGIQFILTNCCSIFTMSTENLKIGSFDLILILLLVGVVTDQQLN